MLWHCLFKKKKMNLWTVCRDSVSSNQYWTRLFDAPLIFLIKYRPIAGKAEYCFGPKVQNKHNIGE